MGKAKMRVSLAFVRSMLHMPEDAKIVGVFMDLTDHANGRMTMLIESPELPEHLPGNEPAWVDPSITSHGNGEFDWDWNL